MNVKNGADVYFTLYRNDSRMRLDHILDNFDSQSCSTLFAADHPWGKQGISNCPLMVMEPPLGTSEMALLTRL